MSDLAEGTAARSPAMPALPAQRLQQQERAIPQRADPGPAPLSFAQQRLWFLEQLEPLQPTYNIPRVYRLRGNLDVPALQDSLAEIVRRHEPLRTVFVTQDGGPQQVIRPPEAFRLPVVDLGHLPETERDAVATQLAAAERQQPFDLSADRMLRAKLLRLAETDHLLVITMHHIASDGWSMGVFWRELTALYHAMLTGQPPSLPALPIQYADYAVWQRAWLQGEVLERQLAYWRRQLADLPPLELPTDRPRLPTHGSRGDALRSVVSAELTGRLRALSRHEDVTLYMLFLAAFQVLLHRYTGQDDFAVGTPIANRNRGEIEPLIGFFVNTLVMRTDLSGNPTFHDLLQRVRQVALDAYDHQDLPLEKLVEELRPERQLGRTPFFQAFFNMVMTGQPTPTLAGLMVEELARGEGSARFNLMLYCRDRGHDVELRLVYRTDQFSQERMAEFLRQYASVLEQLADRPDENIGRYSLVTRASLSLLPDPRRPLAQPAYPGVVEAFLQWVETEPGRIAVEQADKHWTYAELAEKAYRIAGDLQQEGLRKTDVVALSGPRSFELIAAMLGVMLGGGVFLPVALDLPPYRRERMLADGGARYLIEITESPGGASGFSRSLRLHHLAGTACSIPLDRTGATSMIPGFPPRGPDDPTYIFFTSGSTGTPRGIVGRYKGLNHFVHWQHRTFEVGPADRIAHLTNLSFDPVLREIFLPLTCGGVLCVPPRDDMAPEEELTWLTDARITVLHVVPSKARCWLLTHPGHVTLSLRYTFFAGEPLSGALAAEWRRLCTGDSQIVNLYGPTETTMAKAYYRVPADPSDGVQPVGSPLPETQLLIVTSARQLCGIAEPGEIVIRTPFSTLGYLRPPAEDETRFQANWFTRAPDDIVFLTGDVGCYQPDGSVTFLGRRDRQVKVMGVRVELQEIEAVLDRHPCVRVCAVEADERDMDDTRLIAYVVPVGEQPPPDDLRNYLSMRLLPAMLPARYVMLDALPLLPNGKLDRRALPPVDWGLPTVQTEFVFPRTPNEMAVAQIWAEVLHATRVGVHDNFFDLGGHSLCATQVMSRIRRVFRVDPPLRLLFEKPTVAALAASLETAPRISGSNRQAADGSGDPREEFVI